MNSLWIAAVIVFLVLIALIYMRYEAGWLEINRIKFTKSKKGLRLAHLSDIHIGLLKVSPGKVRKVIEAEMPDAVIITGDLIEKPSQTGMFLGFLDSISTGCPIYIMFGNHDYKAFCGDQAGLNAFARDIEEHGAAMFINRSIILEKNSKKYKLVGIDDLRKGSPEISTAIGSDSGSMGTEITTIAFSHNPDIVELLDHKKIDYLFAGHFHGGQIWTPFNLEFRILRDDKLCKAGIKRGLHKVNGIILYISKGLGNVCLPLRFLSRPEITVYYF